MNNFTFTEPLDSDTLWVLSNIPNNEPDLGVVSKTGVQCHAEERDIVIEYLEGETADEVA